MDFGVTAFNVIVDIFETVSMKSPGRFSDCVSIEEQSRRLYWIVQSLPIKKETLYKAKMLFNLYLTVPVTLFSIVTFSISAKAPMLTTLLSLVLGFMLCTFSTTWGCVCGIKHMRLDWENEIEVIKQGAAVALYLFPNMLVCMLLIGFTVGLGTFINQNIVLLIMIVFVSLLAGLNYRKVLSLSRKQS